MEMVSLHPYYASIWESTLGLGVLISKVKEKDQVVLVDTHLGNLCGFILKVKHTCFVL